MYCILPAATLVSRWTLSRQPLSLSSLFRQNKCSYLTRKFQLPPISNFFASRIFSSSSDKSTLSSSSSTTTSTQTESTPVVALIFDTETTGRVKFDHTSTDAIQPDLIQLGFILIDTSTWIPHAKASLLVQLRDGVLVEAGAQSVHGISAEDCSNFGVAADTAARIFVDACEKADVLVAHNINFDAVVMEAALDRASLCRDLSSLSELSTLISSKMQVCTMRESTDLCKLPAKFKSQKYKWPTLSEAYTFVTDGDILLGGHDAMVDAEACLKVFRYLVEEGHVTFEAHNSTELAESKSPDGTTIQESFELLDVVVSQPPTPTSFDTVEITEQPLSGFSVRGNTYAHKDTLREIGGKWNSKSKEWVFSDDSRLSELKTYTDLQVVVRK